MTGFIQGLELSGLFYLEAVKPVLDAEFSDLPYCAALTGAGSEILGFDTEMSADYYWGLRLMLFLGKDDLAECQDAIQETFRLTFPKQTDPKWRLVLRKLYE